MITDEDGMETRKVVFAGCGGVTRAWMGALSEFDDVEVVGLCDLDAGRIDAFQQQWKLSPKVQGDDLRKVIRESGADTVFDCTTPAAHPLVTTTALAEGCDVLGEKPMAPTLEEALRMLGAAKDAGRTYAVIQNRRYRAPIRRFRRALRAAGVGPLTTLDADFYLGPHFSGFRTQMDHVLLLDMAIHTFDQARYISGADAEYVYAADWNPTGSWYRNGANAIAHFEMTDDVRFTYRGSWCAEGSNTSWESYWRASCETGSLIWDGKDEITGERVAGGEGFFRELENIEVPEASELKWEGHAGVIREFLDSLAAGRKPMTDCSDNIKSVAMVLAALESAETGTRVRVWKDT
jgi:predicted dehydrogenase